MPDPGEIDSLPLNDEFDVTDNDPKGLIGLVGAVSMEPGGEDNEFNPYDGEDDSFEEALYWTDGHVREAMRYLRHKLVSGDAVDTVLFGVAVKILPADKIE